MATASIGAFAAEAPKYYSCGGVGDVEEYVAAINLEENKASFFDNDSYSYLDLKKTYSIETIPPQLIMEYLGDDASYSGQIEILFNATKLTVLVTSIGDKGEQTTIGEASCKAVDYWEK